MIVIDCERMRHPNTGLYVFCEQLSRAVTASRVPGDEPLGFYVPAHMAGCFGDGLYYRRHNTLDKLCLLHGRRYKVWHSSYQLTRYMPRDAEILLTVHDLNFIYEKPLAKQRKYLRRLQRNVDRASRIVAISDFTRRDFHRRDGIAEEEFPRPAVPAGGQ